MPRNRNQLDCPRCKEIGGTIVKNAVKGRVQIPKFITVKPIMVEENEGFEETIHLVTLPEGLDFVAKMFLRLEECMIEYPPIDDARFSDSLYKLLEKISAHSRQQISEFKERYLCDDKPLDRINKRETDYIQYDRKSREKKKLRMIDLEPSNPAPVNMRVRLHSSKFKRISRTSVACRYAAILFTVLSRMFRFLRERSIFCPPLNLEKKYTRAICTFFSLLHPIDRRKLIHPLQWPKMLDFLDNCSLGGEITKNPLSVKNLFCCECSKVRQGIFVPLQELQPGIHRCKICGSEKSLVHRLNTRNVKKRKYNFLLEYSSLSEEGAGRFQTFLSTIEGWLTNNSALRKYFLSEFEKQEQAASRSSFHMYSYYFIQHSLPGGKKRRCPLNSSNLLKSNHLLKVKITDATYLEGIRNLAYMYIRGNLQGLQYETILKQCSNKLIEMNYPEDPLLEKISLDMKSAAIWHKISLLSLAGNVFAPCLII